MNQKGFVNIIVIIGIVIFVGIAGYFIVNQQKPSSQKNQITCTPEGGLNYENVYSATPSDQRLKCCSGLIPQKNPDIADAPAVCIKPPPASNQVSPTTTQNTGIKVEYAEGQYIDVVGAVRERGIETGGGKDIMSYIMVKLPKEKSTDDIFEMRIQGINVDFSCVDETLRTGDMARVRGIIEKVVPDIGLILSCNSSETSIIKN